MAPSRAQSRWSPRKLKESGRFKAYLIAASDMLRSQKHDHVSLQITVEAFGSPFAGNFISLHHADGDV
jgi:hypothetical protein